MMNPVFRRETQMVMRSFRTFLAIMLYVGVLLLVAFAFISMQSSGYRSTIQPQNAIYLYWFLGAFQLGMGMVIVTVFAGAAISGERERQTLDLMLTTQMSNISIIIGKLMSSLSVVVLMIVASLPVFSIILYYGGMSVINLLGLAAFTLLMSAMAGSIAILFSALTKRTMVSIVISIIIALAITIGNLIGGIIANVLYYNANDSALPLWMNKIIMATNPGIGFFDLMDSQFGSSNIEMIINLITDYLYDTSNVTPMGIPLWGYTCIFAVVVTVICIVIASLHLRTRDRYKRKPQPKAGVKILGN